MRHGPKVWTEKVIAERIKAGVGAGLGNAYRPWLSVHDLSSRGRQTRTAMVKINRTVHTHSYIERDFLLLAEFRKDFHGIYEQAPIPREVSLGAAKSLGILHPVYPVSRVPVVMTFDFILETLDADGNIEKEPWDCKRESTLERPRILEKLSLHRAAAEHLGLKPARLFTELSVPKQVIRNIEWIRAALPLEGESRQIHELYKSEPDDMYSDIEKNRPRALVAAYCQKYDKRRGFESGTAIRVLAWLLWRHRLAADLGGRHIAQQMLPLPDEEGTLGRMSA